MDNEALFFSIIKLDGSGYKKIMKYKCYGFGYEATEANAVLQSIFNFEATADYIYLDGKVSINAQELTTRFPIAGSWESKEEEIFYKGKWLTVKEYIDVDNALHPIDDNEDTEENDIPLWTGNPPLNLQIKPNN